MIAAGQDPSHELKLAAARERISEENSFKLVAEEWLKKNEREDMAEVTLAKIRWLLDKAYPKLGNRWSDLQDRPLRPAKPPFRSAATTRREQNGKQSDQRRAGAGDRDGGIAEPRGDHATP